MPITGPIRRRLQGSAAVQQRSSGVNFRMIGQGARTLPPLSWTDPDSGLVSVKAFYSHHYSTPAGGMQGGFFRIRPKIQDCIFLPNAV